MKRSRALSVAVSLLLAIFVPAALFPVSTAKGATFVVEMKNTLFHPDFLGVDPGEEVTVVVFNNDSWDHTFRLEAFGVFSGVIHGRDNWTETFLPDRNGTFYFYCTIPGHANPLGGGKWQGMAGRLQVGAAGGQGVDTIPIVVAGAIVLAVSLVVVVVVARRNTRRQKT